MIKPHYLKSIGSCSDDMESEVKRIGGIRGVAPEVDVAKECREFVPPLDVVEERRKAARAKELEDVFA